MYYNVDEHFVPLPEALFPHSKVMLNIRLTARVSREKLTLNPELASPWAHATQCSSGGAGDRGKYPQMV